MGNMYFPDAKPNIIHQKIAASCNKNGTLITQNVDGLDKKAGNKHVIEFHGDLYNIYCTKCHEKISYDNYKKSLEANGRVLNQIKPITVINTPEREDFFFAQLFEGQEAPMFSTK